MTKARVLLADDHRILAEGLSRLLQPEFELVGIVEDGLALLDAVETLRPDVVVADISMPLLNGIEAVKRIKKVQREVKIVFLTMQLDVTYAARAFAAGASGYVLKHSASSELITAITSVLAGRHYVTPLIAGELMEFYRDGRHKEPNALIRLTTRQREVLRQLVKGRSAKEIATILGLSSRTVEFHKYKMMEELGVKTVAELIRFAVNHGVSHE